MLDCKNLQMVVAFNEEDVDDNRETRTRWNFAIKSNKENN